MGFRFDRLRVPCLMGVVNVTPNSFSDGGETYAAGDAIARGRKLVEEGAGILDLGAEASSFFRAGVEPVAVEEQWRRLAPVIDGLIEPRRHEDTKVLLSVDTRSAEVARRAVGAGAEIVNDISAGRFDEQMLEVVAELGCGIVLMHISEPYPETAAEDDADIVRTVGEYLARRMEAAIAAGMKREAIAVDPGIGFGKTMRDNWRLIAGCGALAKLGVSVVMGASRKRFLETEPVEEAAAEFFTWREKLKGLGNHARDAASAAVVRMAQERGVGIHRVHEVGLAMRALAL